MSGLLTPQRTEGDWVLEMPAEMARALGVAEGSLAVLHVEAGKIEVEVLMPSPEMERAASRLHEKYKDAFAELKRLGD
ncbi:MAG: hypothetical protein QOJ02_3305 [Acidobacteriota bacterium]|jgi:hypothetical protein|nr:hypothetical protein [Acidobacteriota bacterium]